jgi:hypothetical protein
MQTGLRAAPLLDLIEKLKSTGYSARRNLA